VAWRGYVVTETLVLQGYGPLVYDPVTQTFVGVFQVQSPPSDLSVISPLGGSASPPVVTIVAPDPTLTIEQVSATGGQEPIMDGRWLTWHGSDGDEEIFVSDACTIQPITVNPFEDHGSRVQAGVVVWQGRDDIPVRVDDPGAGQGGQGYILVGGDFEVWKWANGTIDRLTDNEFDDIDPRMDGALTVWRGWDGEFFQILMNDGASTAQLTSDANDHAHARVDGGQIVWQAWDGQDYEIFLWNGLQIVQLTDNTFNDLAPEIDSGRVVWFGNPPAFDIYLWDGTQVVQLTSAPDPHIYPQISGDRIVWQGWDGADFEIYLYDGLTTVQLTSNDQLDERPRLDDAHIVWQARDGFDLEVFVFDGTSTRRVTGNTWDDLFPTVSDGVVAWQGYDGEAFQIFKVVLPEYAPAVCPPPGGNP
jgi:beta propeller repeat protein